MRLIGYFLCTICLFGFFSCSELRSLKSSNEQKTSIQLDRTGTDSTEYDIIVMDPGFESWFIKNRKQPWYHTKEILAVKNWQYVISWNQKVRDGQFQMRNPRNPFTEHIEYRRDLDYGLDVNYKLYYYFKYIEDTWGKFW